MKAISSLLRFALLIGLYFLIPNAVSAQGSVYEFRDSLHKAITTAVGKEKLDTYSRLTNSYIPEISNTLVADTILTIYNAMDAEAAKQGDIGYQAIAKANRINALLMAKQYDKLKEEASVVLDFTLKNEQWKAYYQTAIRLIEAYRLSGYNEEGLNQAQKIYDFAKVQKSDDGMGVVIYAISRIYLDMRRFTEAEEGFKESIALLKNSRSFMSILTEAYHRLITSYIGQERYDEALMFAKEYEEIIPIYEATSKSSLPSVWGNLWLNYIDLYRQIGDADMTMHYINKVDSLSRGAMRLYKQRGHLLYLRRQYNEAIEMLDKEIAAYPNMMEAKGLKMLTYIRQGAADEAIKLFYQIIKEQDALYEVRYNSQLDALRTEYEVDKYIAEKKRNLNYFLFTLGVCILSLLLLGITFYYNRTITKKNRNLYQQIKEQDRLAEELVLTRNITENAETSPINSQQYKLVLHLREYLLRDNNLTNIDIDRSDVITTLGTNKNILSEAVKAVTGKTPMEYIRLMQLEEARRMLDNYPELTIESISANCGFNTSSTFYRSFRKHYGITPTEYRKMAG